MVSLAVACIDRIVFFLAAFVAVAVTSIHH